MRKVILWGSRQEYDLYRRAFEVEQLKSNMQIMAIVLNEGRVAQYIDGVEVIAIEELLVRDYDYLIDMNKADSQTIRRILDLLDIPLEKVISAKAFVLPFFDLERYIEVRESRVSIISNHCWGGYTYHSLGLQFLSPFINLFLDADSYIKLLSDFEYYMNLPLQHIRDEYEANLKRNYPVVGLEDVTIYFNHYAAFDDAVAIWNKRKGRINQDNLLVEMTISHPEDIEKFAALPFEHKVGFTMIPCSIENIVYIPVKDKECLFQIYGTEMWDLMNKMASADSLECIQYDILKLLAHEKDFMRYIY